MSLIGGSEQLAIGIALYMRDGFSAQADKASLAYDRLRNQGDQLARQQATQIRNMNAVGAAAGVC